MTFITLELNDRYISAYPSPVFLVTIGVVRLARQDALHLRDLGQDVGHGPVGVGVELQIERDRADILRRGRDQRVDAFRARHRLLDRHGDEALDEIGVGARIDSWSP